MSTFTNCPPDCPDTRRHFDEACARREYPDLDHLIGGLARFFNGGIQPGHLLTAVLGNDLHETYARADPQTVAVLPRLMMLLYNHAPAPSYGTADRVVAWRERVRDERSSATTPEEV